MSQHIGTMITKGNGLQVNTFSGPGGALGVALTPSGGPVDQIELRGEEQVKNLIRLLEAALQREYVGPL
jgi:hypothetical protein